MSHTAEAGNGTASNIRLPDVLDALGRILDAADELAAVIGPLQDPLAERIERNRQRSARARRRRYVPSNGHDRDPESYLAIASALERFERA